MKKRQKKITSLLQPAKEPTHLRDEHSDVEIREEEAIGHPDEAVSSLVREEEIRLAAEHAEKEAMETTDVNRDSEESLTDVRQEEEGGSQGADSDSAPLSTILKNKGTIRSPTPHSKTTSCSPSPAHQPTHSPTYSISPISLQSETRPHLLMP